MRDIQGNLDFSGLEQFLSITSLLEDDVEPDDSRWDALFETPGYKTLTEREFERDILITLIITAFKPSKKECLEGILKNKNREARLLEHYINIKAMKNLIPDFVEQLKSNTMEEDILDKVKEYFPLKSLDKLPMISFLVFDNDARGYKPIVVDIGFAINLNKSLPLLLAHEVHHYFRNQICTINYEEIDDIDFNIIRTLNQIHMEGIADQIDKHIIYDETNPVAGMESFAKKYWEYVRQSHEIIKSMDNILCEISCNKDYGQLSLKFSKAVPMSGHPLGFHMAKTISDKMGRAALAVDIGNPFAFFRRYNEAVKRFNSNEPVFSSKAMNVINILEKKYNKDN